MTSKEAFEKLWNTGYESEYHNEISTARTFWVAGRNALKVELQKTLIDTVMNAYCDSEADLKKKTKVTIDVSGFYKLIFEKEERMEK